jgi:hypothetical protein
MAGVPERVVESPLDFSARCETMRSDPRYAGMTEHDMREFLKEEQREGIHPSLKGKHF